MVCCKMWLQCVIRFLIRLNQYLLIDPLVQILTFSFTKYLATAVKQT